jgi:hypothetical protein
MSSYQAPPRKPTAEDPLVVAAREAGMPVDNAPAPTSNVVSLASARRSPTNDATARILEKYRITLDFSRADEVEIRRVEWLWPERLARGKLTIITGDPNVGKSQISLDVAARLSRAAPWPDGSPGASGSTLVLSAEDATSDTVVPRLMAAGADLARVGVLNAARDGDRSIPFNLQHHLEALGRKVAELGDVALVIIDPITAYMGKIDSHRATDVRAVLEPLAAFAEEHGVAVLAVSHPTKATQSKALYSITGSLAYVAAARMVLLAAQEPESDRRLLLGVKNNLGPLPPGLGFDVERTLVGEGVVTSRVAWDGRPVTTTADEAMTTPDRGGKLTEAVDFLREELACGPRPQKQLEERAEGEGISPITLRRAKKSLRIESTRIGFGGEWVWGLPTTNGHPTPIGDHR